MKHKTIFDYLDHALADINNPSKDDIAKAKQEYYKEWHRHYNRKRRKTRKEFTLGFYPEVFDKIKSKKGTQSVSKYLYGVVYDAIGSTNASNNSSQRLSHIHHKLMHIITSFEELLDNDALPIIEPLLEQIEALELEFRKL